MVPVKPFVKYVIIQTSSIRCPSNNQQALKLHSNSCCDLLLRDIASTLN